MTEFTHYTLLADGEVFAPNLDFDTERGRYIMAMKVWATDADQAADMIVAIGERLGFKPDGELQVFMTEPDEPADDEPFGYDIQFTSYSADEENEAGEEERPKWIH
nr:hypothetical protein [uncultured Hyphomonas sp.]